MRSANQGVLKKAASVSGLAQQIGGKVSNHSVRKTTISRLLDANTPENFVAQLSGHKNTQSLQNYKSASEQHQRQMSMILSRKQSTLVSIPSSTNNQIIGKHVNAESSEMAIQGSRQMFMHDSVSISQHSGHPGFNPSSAISSPAIFAGANT